MVSAKFVLNAATTRAFSPIILAVTCAPDDPSLGWAVNGLVMSMTTLFLSELANFRTVSATWLYGMVIIIIWPASIAACTPNIFD